ncbi:MAG: ATP-binding protein [Melioribacteraceae bacterium]
MNDSKETEVGGKKNLLIIIASVLLIMVLISILAIAVVQSSFAATTLWISFPVIIFASSIIAAFISFLILRRYSQSLFPKSTTHNNNTQIYTDSLLNPSLLEATIESIADGIYVTDKSGKVARANKKFASMWKIPQHILNSSIDGELLSFILDQVKEPEAFRKKIQDIYADPAMESHELIEFKDGRVFERFSKPQRLEDEIVGRVWSFRDITNQKRIEADLIKERLLLRMVIDNLPDAIYVKDSQYRKTLANRTDLENMGCSSEAEAIGKTDFDFFSKDVAELFYEDDKKIIEEGQIIFNREEFFIDKSGRKSWLLTSKIPLRDDDGQITGLLGIGHNINVRKKSELVREALYEISETAYAASDMISLYEKIREVIGSLMKVNNFYIALYDEETDMVSFPYMIDEFDPPYQPKKFGRGLTEYILRTGEATLIDTELDLELQRTGEVELVGTPTVIWLGVPLKIGGKTIGVIVVQDYADEKTFGEEEMQILVFVAGQIAQVIERKRNSDALNQFALELKEANQSKDKFFSIIAHDLKSPFQGLLGYSQILSTEYDTLSEEEKKLFISSIDELSISAYKLLENLLEWSRLQTGKMAFNPEQLNLLIELYPTLSLVKQTAWNKEIELTYSIDNSIFVQADKNMLSTIVRNLISNSIKFTKPGGLINVTSKVVDNFVELSISDTGVGMSKNDLEKLFKLDKTISTKGTANEEGTGLGLLLCKEMINQHKGKIWVESELGKGTTFFFTLPIK